MLTDSLIKITTKGNTNYKDRNVRSKIGFLSGIIGIIVNIILFALKISIGVIVSSVAVIADAFNNLTDAASSVITIIGFKMASMPADKNHPYGHGRIEYIAALIISFLVMFVGLQFIKTSAGRIMSPEPVVFELIPFIILIISITFKLWLAKFNKNLGNKINSSSLKATATDALGDVFITLVVIISIFISKFTTFPIDGYIGIFVAIFILYAGYKLTKETVSPLIGEAPDKEFMKEIEDALLSYKYITGVHDLIIHNYGPGRTMASIHAEIPANIDIMTIHEVIDKAEREISDDLDIHLVIHMDPISVDSKEVSAIKHEISKIIKYNPIIKSMHDFRVVGSGEHRNLIFDIVVDSINLDKISSEDELKSHIIDSVKEMYPHYNCIITIDKDY